MAYQFNKTERQNLKTITTAYYMKPVLKRLNSLLGSPKSVRIIGSESAKSSPQMPHCPNCQSTKVVKNGRIHNGKQNHKCRDCGRQFVENPQQKIISSETKQLIDKLLLEKIPLAGIARVCEVSEPWLQQYVNQKYKDVPRQVQLSSKKKGA